MIMHVSAQDPLSLLRKMERATLESAPTLPEENEGPSLWTGVGFRLGDLHLVTPIAHVVEVLPYPVITPVPGTKSWIKGIANVRGNLLTIIDLPEFFGKGPVFEDDQARLLVMNVDGLNAAVLVDEVLGLRHFDETEERQNTSNLDDPVVPYLRGVLLREKVLWGVFDMHSLAASSSFMHVAA
ncbi:MAG: chemotaxis protein CheW [Gammaproteobacteria bacterium]|nr:chemotaxis protein CheW [Gammaproteobacteria bacterium]